MKRIPNGSTTLLLLSSVLALAGCGDKSGSAGGQTAALPEHETARTAASIDELYSQPSIIGTSPERPNWSADGRKLAFLWNDEGRPFRDVWSWSAEGSAKVRLTDHGSSEDKESLQTGISEAVWLASDAGELVYVLNGTPYLLNADGDSASLAGVKGAAHDLGASPTDGQLAFIANGALWAGDPRTDEGPRPLFEPDHERAFVERYEWSKDGRQLAFVEVDDTDVRQIEIHYDSGGESRTHTTTRAFPGDETSKRRVGVVRLDDGEVRWFDRSDSQHPIWGFGLSADGSRLFIDSSDFLIKTRTIHVYDIESGQPTVWYESTDEKKVSPAWSAAWAPDDEGLIVLSDDDGWFHLYHLGEAGSPPRQLTRGEWEIGSFEVDAQRQQIYFLANEAHRSQLQIYQLDMATGEVKRISKKPGTHVPVFSPDFSSVADRFSNDTTPPDLYVQELHGGAPVRRVTDSPLPAFDEIPLADVSYIEFTSHIDGAPLLGRLSLPRDYDSTRRYPLLMGSVYPNSVRNRWGAGNAIPTWGLDQHLVERGYILMKVDTRGSWGHGKAVRQGQFRDYGGIDKDDVQSGAIHLIDAGIADPDRIAIFGWSYGGLMTLMSLFHNPDFYAAGIADAPATNVAHAFPQQMWVMGRPEGEDFPERYERMSALYHSDGLTKPLMITHATKDDVVLYGDTIALTERMIAAGKLFELVTMPGSRHVWADDNASQKRFGYRKMVEFFDRHLMSGEPANPSRD